jgi:hypothetical protein
MTAAGNGRERSRPLADAAGLFRRWRDLTNAERMNHWLAVLAENALLVTSALEPPRDPEG